MHELCIIRCIICSIRGLIPSVDFQRKEIYNSKNKSDAGGGEAGCWKGARWAPAERCRFPDRALSSLYVRVNGQAMLIDCGEGTQVGIRRLGWGFRCLDGLLLTHFHGDHCTGVPGLLLSLEKAGREETFHIWGPQGAETGDGGPLRDRSAAELSRDAA